MGGKRRNFSSQEFWGRKKLVSDIFLSTSWLPRMVSSRLFYALLEHKLLLAVPERCGPEDALFSLRSSKFREGGPHLRLRGPF